jgi:transcriptional regulator GlxA family with amidase domain
MTGEIRNRGQRRRSVGTGKRRRPISVWILVFADFLLLDAAGPAQVFSTANDAARECGAPIPYKIRLISNIGGAVASSSGVEVLTGSLPKPACLRDGTLLVAGGPGISTALAAKSLVSWTQRAYRVLARCCSVCTGVFLLARAGLLKKRRVTTHWMDVQLLRSQYPAVDVVDDAIYVRDGRIYTSAGITAGMDLCLGIVEEDLGRAAALAVAKRLVLYHKRPGGQRQFSSELLAQTSLSGLAGRLTSWIRPRVGQRIDVVQMSDAVAVSARTLHRRLRSEAGISPLQLVTRVRMEKACILLESGAVSINQVARTCGFGSEYNLRRAFAQHLRILPSDYKARFG